MRALVALLLVVSACTTTQTEPAQLPPPITATTSTTTTTTSTMVEHQTPVTIPATIPTVPIPSAADLACGWIARLDTDRYLEKVGGLCRPVAQAGHDIYKMDLPNIDTGEFVFGQYRLDVLHMLYVVAAESGGDPLANGRNWGCPHQEELRPFHPDPDGHAVDGRQNCSYYQNRVPIAWVSHMSHLVTERSNRLLGQLINPYDLYDAALLGFGLVDEIGGNGWYAWWHSAWSLNRYTSRHGIRPTWYCPPNSYWARVKGGRQECPTG